MQVERDLKIPTYGNSLKLDNIYFMYNENTGSIVVGEWNNSDIGTISVQDMVTLRRYLDHKIIKFKVSQLKTKDSPF